MLNGLTPRSELTRSGGYGQPFDPTDVGKYRSKAQCESRMVMDISEAWGFATIFKFIKNSCVQSASRQDFHRGPFLGLLKGAHNVHEKTMPDQIRVESRANMAGFRNYINMYLYYVNYKFNIFSYSFVQSC
jgi:hypothetical protein